MCSESPHSSSVLLKSHDLFMLEAVALAEKGKWHTSPNPCVGAVMVKNNEIVARGWHKFYGGAHAEVNCIDDAINSGVDLKDCTLYVTLEPCTHTGKTGPCAKVIVDAGIPNVVVGVRDPNPIAAGGIDFLQMNGVHVECGVKMRECTDLIADFTIWQTEKRPYVILKLAQTLDGHTADRFGFSKWISNPDSRKMVHKWRANIGIANGVVMIGGNTFVTDNPLLTARDVPCTRQPRAFVIMSKMPNDIEQMKLISQRPNDTILFLYSMHPYNSQTMSRLKDMGISLYVPRDEYSSELTSKLLYDALAVLYRDFNCPYVFCEGGSHLAHSLLMANLVDEIHIYTSPKTAY